MSNRKTDLATLAQRAGVSVSTVSKVIHGRAGVSSATRSRIRQLLAETGYVSPIQRHVRESGPPMIDLVIGGTGDGYSMEVLQGILTAAQSTDVDVVISSVTPENLHRADAEAWVNRMAASGRSGLILVTSQLSAAQRRVFTQHHMPVVVIDPLGPSTNDLASVGSTNWAGSKLATEYLLSLGHRRIAFIGGNPAAECHEARWHGYLAALRAHGLEVPQDYVAPGGAYTRSAGIDSARKLLDLPTPPTAIFASSDEIALGVLEVAHERGLEIPRDLSVVGFDGLPLSEQSLPPLTTVAQPLRDMGRAALRTVLQLARGETLESTRIELATVLTVRGSTAPADVGRETENG